MFHELLLMALPPLIPVVPTLKYFGGKMERSPLVAFCLALMVIAGVLWHDNIGLREDLKAAYNQRVEEQIRSNKAEKEARSEEIVRMAKYDVIFRELKEKDQELQDLRKIVKTKKIRR